MEKDDLIGLKIVLILNGIASICLMIVSILNIWTPL